MVSLAEISLEAPEKTSGNTHRYVGNILHCIDIVGSWFYL